MKIAIKKMILLLFLMSITALSFGQNNSRSTQVKSIFAQKKSTVETYQVDSKTKHKDNHYAMVEFEEMLNENILKNLTKKNIQVLSYHGEGIYTLSIPNKLNGQALKNLSIKYITNDFGKTKIAQSIRDNDIPETANPENDYLTVVLIFHKDVNLEEINTELKRLKLNRYTTDIGKAISVRVKKATIDQLAESPLVSYIRPYQGKPEVFNYENRASHNINILNISSTAGGYDLDGQGVTVGVGDNGFTGSHFDLEGRITTETTDWAYGAFDHTDHVHGTIGGAGILDELQKGIAASCTMITEFFYGIIYSTVNLSTNHDMVITSNSYGYGFSCGLLGEYDNLSEDLDDIALQEEEVLHIYAAGNYGQFECNDQPLTYSNVPSGPQCAKNTLVVGNINYDRNIHVSSSRGPTLDGRLKPEICAIGTSVTSTSRNNNYSTKTGTSMSTPTVSGTVALMIEQYREENAGANPKSGLMKVIACNTAEDLGNKGPDYTYGFGTINGKRAIDNIISGQYIIGSIDNANSTKTHQISLPSNAEALKVMLYWHDPSVASGSAPILVSDLNLTVTDPANNTINPWVLDPANPEAVATRGVDNINNIEQVTISNSAAGLYTFTVNAASLPFGVTQEYFISYDIIYPEIEWSFPLGGETLLKDRPTAIYWNATDDSNAPFVLEYTIDGGNTWVVLDASIPADARHHVFTPVTITSQAKFRISRGAYSSTTNDPIVVMGRPEITNLEEGTNNDIAIQWSNIASADSYEVYYLNPTTLQWEWILNTTNTSALINKNTLPNQDEIWFSVIAKTTTGASSIRSEAKKIRLVPTPENVNDIWGYTLGHDRNRIRWFDDHVTNEDEFVLERSLSSTGGFQMIVTLPANSDRYVDEGLTENTFYYYRIKAVNAYGASNYSRVFCLKTKGCDPDVDFPGFPSNTIATVLSETSIQVTWNDNACNETEYFIYVNDELKGTYDRVAILPANTTSYIATDLDPCTQYCYWVVPNNNKGRALGGSETRDCATTTDQMLLAPSGLVLSNPTENSVDLAWIDNSNNENEFRIERSEDMDLDYFIVGVVDANTTTFTDAGLDCEKQYNYRVRAVKECTLSEPSNVDNEITQDCSSEENIACEFAINDPVGINVSGTASKKTITKTSPNSDWPLNDSSPGGGLSDIMISEGDYFTFRLSDRNTFVIGLSETDSEGATFNTIDHGMYLWNSSQYFVINDGLRQHDNISDAFDENTIFRIAFSGGVVKYYKDNTLIGSTIASATNYYVDFSIYDQNAKILDLEIFSDCIPEGVCEFDLETHANADGYTVTGSTIKKTITKTAPTGNGNAIACTTTELLKEGDYYQFKLKDGSSYIAALNSGNGFWANQDGTIDILGGASDVATYTDESIFRIVLSNENLLFYVNENLFYENLNVDPDIDDLRFRAFFYDQNAQVVDLEMYACGSSATLDYCSATYNLTVDNGISVVGNTITKTVSGWKGGASDIAISNGEYITYKVKEDQNVAVGLSKTDTDGSWDSIDFGMYTKGNEKISIIGDGNIIENDYTTYTASSLLKIEVLDGKINFYKDGNNFYSLDMNDPNDSYVVDFSMATINSEIIDLEIFEECSTPVIELCDTDYNLSVDNGISIVGNIITKTVSGWKGGASDIMVSNGEYITYKVKENQNVVVGLSKTDTDGSWNTIEYAMYTKGNEKISIIEDGSIIENDFTSYTDENTLKIEVLDGKINFYKDGNNFYSLDMDDPNDSYVVDFSMATINSEIIDLEIFKECSTPVIELCDTAYNLTVDNGISIVGNIITKTVSGWKGGASDIVVSNGEYITYKVKEDQNVVVGLSKMDTDGSWNTIEYGMYTKGNEKISIIGGGNIIENDYTTYTTSSLLKIEVLDGKINFYKDGNNFYSLDMDDPNDSYVVDFSMATINSEIIDLAMFKECQSNNTRLVGSTDINSIEEDILSQTKLYPNPSSNQFNIDFSEGITFPVQLQMFSLTGQQIMTKELNQYTNVFQTANLAKGIYLIRLQEKDKIQQIKLVIQ